MYLGQQRCELGQVLHPGRGCDRLYKLQSSCLLDHNHSDCTKMISTLLFSTLLSSAVAVGVRIARLKISQSVFNLSSNIKGMMTDDDFASVSKGVGLWSGGSLRNETGGGDRCTCDAFLPTSTFPIGKLVVVEQTAVELSHRLELEMGKVLRLCCSIKKFHVFE